MVWSRRSAICMTVAAGLLYPGLLSAQEMPSEYKTVLTALGKGGDFRGFLTQMYARFWNDLADHASA